MRATALQTPRPAQREAGGAPAPSAAVPRQPAVQPLARQAVPLSPRRAAVEQIPTRSPRGPQAGAGRCPEEAVPRGQPALEQLLAGPVAPCRGARAGAGLLAGPVPPRGPALEPLCPRGCARGGTRLGRAGKGCCPGQGSRWRRPRRTVSMGGNPRWSRGIA